MGNTVSTTKPTPQYDSNIPDSDDESDNTSFTNSSESLSTNSTNESVSDPIIDDIHIQPEPDPKPVIKNNIKAIDDSIRNIPTLYCLPNITINNNIFNKLSTFGQNIDDSNIHFFKFQN